MKQDLEKRIINGIKYFEVREISDTKTFKSYYKTFLGLLKEYFADTKEENLDPDEITNLFNK